MDDHSPADPPSPESGARAPRHVRALRQRADAAERRGLEHLERTFFKSSAESLEEAAHTYEELGETTNANSARQYLALALYEQGQIDQALDIWETLVSTGWDRPTTFNFLIRHYEREGDDGEVERLYGLLQQTKADTSGSFFDEYGEATQAGEASVTLPEAAAEGPRRILVADNDPLIRSVLDPFLARLGYEVVLAEDGEEALNLIFSTNPDLVFLDIYMPKHSGLDVLYRLRAEGIATPVVVISGRSDATMARDCRVLGAHFASKPLDFAELEALVIKLLAKSSG